MGRLSRWHARFGALAARGWFRFAVFSALSLVATWALLRTAGGVNNFRDSQFLIAYEDIARRTVLEYGQLPLWNPYYCGGMYGWGGPQTRYVSPPFLLTLIFGAFRAEPLQGFVLLALTLEGTFRYVRARGATAAAALLAAPVFGLSGFLAASPMLGWTQFYSFGAIPFALLGARRAGEGKIRGAVMAGAAFGFMVGFGGTYPVPFTALFCVGEFLDRALRRPRLAHVGHAVLSMLFVAGLCLYRLWPVMETMQRAPRIIGGMSGTPVGEVFKSLFVASPLGDSYTWHLVGVLAVPALLASLFAFRRAWGAWVLALASLWLTLGYEAKPSLFALLRELPIYSTLRYPDRFMVIAAAYFAALAGVGLTRLFVLARRNRRRPLEGLSPFRRALSRLPTFAAPLLALCLVGNVGLLLYNFQVTAEQRGMGPIPVERPGEFKQTRGSRYVLPLFPPMNLGVLSCYEAYQVAQSPLLRADLPAEEYLRDPASGTVARKRWTPNALTLDVTLNAPGRLLVNQNFHTGWRSNVGSVVDHEGLLAVDLPAGRHEVKLYFLPRSAVGGAAASLCAIGAAIFLVRRFRRRSPRGREWALVLGLGALPLVVAASSFVLIPEPAAKSLALVTETGEPVIADSPPPSARPLDVKLDRGVVLEAVRTEWIFPGGEPQLVLELDWKLTQRLKGHGVFVHLHTTSGERFTPDHPLISGVLSFDAAPVGKTLRDVSVISLASKHLGKTMDVFVGLWNIHGDGSRLVVVDPGKGDISENRVLVYRGPVPDARLPDGGVIPPPPDAGAPDAGP